MLCLAVWLERCNSIDYILKRWNTFISLLMKFYSHFFFNILSTHMYASTQAFEFSLFSSSILRWWWDLALKAIVVYNFNKLLKKILPQNPLVCRKANRAHKLLSLNLKYLYAESISTINGILIKIILGTLLLQESLLFGLIGR